jgi:hypothetical protein
MALWTVVAHEDFPIWVIARRLIHRERFGEKQIRWLLESDESVRSLPRSTRGIISVEPAEETEIEKVAAR